MNVLVTGGAGYIGSVIVELLQNAGEAVIVLDNLSQGHRQAVPDGVVFIEGDTENDNLLHDIFKNHEIDAVIHMAAEALVERSMTDPRGFFHENVLKSVTLINTMLDCGIDKFILSSTCAVYGEPQKIPIDESHPENPTNAYGESKFIFERILRWYHHAYGLKFISLRYFNAAGASERFGEDHDPETHLIPIVLKAALGQRDKVLIYGTDYPTRDGTCIRDYVQVVDLAEAHILALKRLDEIQQGIYNLGNGQGNSVREVIETARKITGKIILTIKTGRRPGDPAVLVASPERARRELGWAPKFQSLDLIVESAWKWHQAHPHGYREP